MLHIHPITYICVENWLVWVPFPLPEQFVPIYNVFCRAGNSIIVRLWTHWIFPRDWWLHFHFPQLCIFWYCVQFPAI